MIATSYELLTYDYPPALGGAARYHQAVAQALAPCCAVTIPAREAHWATLLRSVGSRPWATHIIVGEILPLGTVAWSRWLCSRGPYSAVCHGLDLKSAQRVPRKEWLARRILAHAERVVVNSTTTRALALALGAPEECTTIIPPPLALRTDLPAAGIATLRRAHGLIGAHIVLSVGRLVARKGFDTLLDAMAVVCREVPKATLVIVGDGPERGALEHQARAHAIPCIFVRATDAEIIAWYRTCDVFALLPRELPNGDIEGFGMVYLEANAFGKPVVGTRSGGVPDAVMDGVTGILVPPNDVRTAAQAIRELLEDATLAERLGANGRRRALEDFSAQRFTERVRTCFASVPSDRLPTRV